MFAMMAGTTRGATSSVLPRWLQPSSSPSPLTWAAITMALLTLSLSPIHQVSSQLECSDHADCPSNMHCAGLRFCELCYWCHENYMFFDAGPCPEKCRCSTHQQCAALEGLPYFDTYYNGTERIPFTRGMFCASYGSEEDFDGDGINDTEVTSICTSCQVLYDIGLFVVPEQDDDDASGYAGDDGRNQSGTTGPSQEASSSCSDIPCLCVTSSDCPEDHYCASNISAYVPDNFLEGSHWLDGKMGPCKGYCVSCSRGCLDDAIVYHDGNGTAAGDGDDAPSPPTCRDVCDPKYIECDTHADCQGSASYNNTQWCLHNGECNTQWCSANHQCNICSHECADSPFLSAYYGREQSFPPIDGACPSSCCGWGMEPTDWLRPFPDVLAPCGTTNKTELLAAFLPSYIHNVTPWNVDSILAYGVPCVVNETEYWQHSTADEQGPLLSRKAAFLDCSQVDYLPCDQYPIRWAFMIKANSSKEYTFLFQDYDLTTVNGPYCGYGDDPSSIGGSEMVFIIVVSLVGLTVCSCALRAYTKRRNGGPESGGATASTLRNSGNAPPSSSLPAAIPASIFDLAAAAPPPPKALPMEGPNGGNAVSPTPQTGQEAAPSDTSAPSADIESDDEA